MGRCLGGTSARVPFLCSATCLPSGIRWYTQNWVNIGYTETQAIPSKPSAQDNSGSPILTAEYLGERLEAAGVGFVMFGKHLDDGTETYHTMELARLAFPRRMYTQSHFDYAAEAIAEVKAKAHLVRGVKIAKQSIAYGYRDEDYFFLKILAAFPGNP